MGEGGLAGVWRWKAIYSSLGGSNVGLLIRDVEGNMSFSRKKEAWLVYQRCGGQYVPF